MKGIVSLYEMVTPRSFAEALELKSKDGADITPFAGGTDLMVLLEAGLLKPARFLNLWPLAELRSIIVSEETVTIGALATYSQIARHDMIRKEFPNLACAAGLTGATAIQNRGTLGGNIANASPAADSPPALLSYDASLVLASGRGVRTIPYGSFHTNYKQTLLKPDELIAAITLPRQTAGRLHHYIKVGTRRAQAISKVVFAGSATVENGKVHSVRLAYGSVAPVTLRLHAAEQALAGQPLTSSTIANALTATRMALAPIDDIRSTAAFRLAVSVNVLRSCLEAWSEAGA